jgi:hypothetical protein
MMQQGQDVGHSQLAIFRGRNVAEMRNSLVVNLFFNFLDCEYVQICRRAFTKIGMF